MRRLGENNFLIYVWASLFTVAAALAAPVSASGSRVLAEGDGFIIDHAYMEAIEDFYSVSTFGTSFDEYLRAALNIKVFAAEARSMGLDPLKSAFHDQVLEQKGELAVDTMLAQVLEDISMAEAFSAHNVQAYPVDSLVVESYYYSFPNRFLDEDGLLPLDDTLRESIRYLIKEIIVKRITDGIYAELEKKYAVKINR